MRFCAALSSCFPDPWGKLSTEQMKQRAWCVTVGRTEGE